MASPTHALHGLRALATGLLAALALHGPASAQTPAAAGRTSILFIGNSFTYAAYSPVKFWRAGAVTDLNSERIGGVPSLFKVFAEQSGLDYEVQLETRGGVGLDWHLENKSATLAKRGYDQVVMHGFSTLDAKKPGDPATLVKSAGEMAALLARQNPQVQIHLAATWSRPDMTYPAGKPWSGKDIFAMANDVRAGYDQAKGAHPAIRSVIPVGEAFSRAIRTGVADANPYDGIEPGKVDLWAYDQYHGSHYGYYLEALVMFGRVTGRDPRALGPHECAAFELGISPAQATALQQVAFDELAAQGPLRAAPLVARDATGPGPCPLPR